MISAIRTIIIIPYTHAPQVPHGFVLFNLYRNQIAFYRHGRTYK